MVIFVLVGVSRRGQPRPEPVTAISTPVASEAYIEAYLDAVGEEREASAVGRRAQLLPEPVSLHPVCDRIPPFPAGGLLHAMAFDGEVYDKPAFFSYYDDAAFQVWNSARFAPMQLLPLCTFGSTGLCRIQKVGI